MRKIVLQLTLLISDFPSLHPKGISQTQTEQIFIFLVSLEMSAHSFCLTLFLQQTGC